MSAKLCQIRTIDLKRRNFDGHFGLRKREEDDEDVGLMLLSEMLVGTLMRVFLYCPYVKIDLILGEFVLDFDCGGEWCCYRACMEWGVMNKHQRGG
jgi:hypothetical protein